MYNDVMLHTSLEVCNTLKEIFNSEHINKLKGTFESEGIDVSSATMFNKLLYNRADVLLPLFNSGEIIQEEDEVIITWTKIHEFDTYLVSALNLYVSTLSPNDYYLIYTTDNGLYPGARCHTSGKFQGNMEPNVTLEITYKEK